MFFITITSQNGQQLFVLLAKHTLNKRSKSFYKSNFVECCNFLITEDWEESVDSMEESTTKTMRLTIGDVLKWMTGQSHVPILPAEKRQFMINFQINHNCAENLGEHRVCYPTVSACTQTVTLPVQHLNTLQHTKISPLFLAEPSVAAVASTESDLKCADCLLFVLK